MDLWFYLFYLCFFMFLLVFYGFLFLPKFGNGIAPQSAGPVKHPLQSEKLSSQLESKTHRLVRTSLWSYQV